MPESFHAMAVPAQKIVHKHVITAEVQPHGNVQILRASQVDNIGASNIAMHSSI